MPIRLPELDNKTFDDLMKEMIASIPRYSKEWTNYNPSEPGITVLELLAWVTEGLLYRTNQIPKESYINFLRLVAGPDEPFDKTDLAHQKLFDYLEALTQRNIEADVLSMKSAAQEFLNSRFTAVTADDFRTLALEASGKIKRVEVFPATYYVEVKLVLETDDKSIIEDERETVRAFLTPRLLLGTMVIIENAHYTDVELSMTIVCKSYVRSDFQAEKRYKSEILSLVEDDATKFEDRAAYAIFKYLDRLQGGPDGKGWPYGRNLMIYELYHVIEMLGDVVSVNQIKIINPSDASFPLKVDGLIRLNALDITVISEES